MPSELVFLDSSGWIALLNSRDENHARAVVIWRDLVTRQARVVLTDWIIAETGNSLAKTPLRQMYGNAVRLVMNREEYQVVMVDRDTLSRSTELYANRPDKSWGLVDCASFVVMIELGIRDSLTADHHFEQAGFHPLLNRGGWAGGSK